MNKKVLLKSVGIDFVLNFLAQIVISFSLQIVLYPMINRMIGTVKYGEFLVVISVVNIISAMIGSALNNVRLIMNEEYKQKCILGDFNFILSYGALLGLMVTTLICVVLYNMSFKCSFLIGMQSFCSCLRSYWMVSYRLTMNYRQNLIANICLGFGYLFGIFFLFYLEYWSVPFIVGDICCLIYIGQTTNIINEPYNLTVLKFKTLKSFFLLAVTTLIGNVVVYLDKFILYPILGGEGVVTYYVASLFGKSIGIVMNSLSGVLLSYFSNNSFFMSKKRFLILLSVSVFLVLIMFGAIVLIAPFFIKVLYPDIYIKATNIIIYANLAIIADLICGFINPAILKIAQLKWQATKEIIVVIIYVVLGMCLTRKYGILGFCFANIFSSFFRMFFLIFVGFFNSNTSKKVGDFRLNVNK